MNINTGEIWGRRDHGGKIKNKGVCPPFHVIDRLGIGAGTSQVHSALDMNCINVNDIGLSNPMRSSINLNFGQSTLGNSGVNAVCPNGSFLNESIIQHDNITGKSSNIQQIVLNCRDPSGKTEAIYKAGENTGKNTTNVVCGNDSYFNEVFFTEGGTNITGIGFNCFDASEIVNDDGWRRLNCCRTKDQQSNECGSYFKGPGGRCDTYARDFCTAGTNWMMPACVKWAEDNSTDMDSYYISKCQTLTTPVDPITNGNFITFKFDNGKYLNIEFGKPVLSDTPLEFRIIDTGLRFEVDGMSEPIYEFTTVEDMPKYLQIYNYVDENAGNDLSFETISRNGFQNKDTDFGYGNPFQFLIREIGGQYWIEKYAVRITRDSATGVERFPVYLSYEGNKVVSSETPSYIDVEIFDRGRVVCSCINAVDDLPPILVDAVGAVGAQAFCFSQDCVTGGGYKTEGQKREPCNQNLTICSTNINIESELESGGVDIGKIEIDQNCGPDNTNPSLGDPTNPKSTDDMTRILIVFSVLIIVILLLK